MFNYIEHNRQARFLIIGIMLTILGFISKNQSIWQSRILFYVAIIFLGYYATNNAIVDTIKERKPNVDLLMILSAIGAIFINYESEGALLLIIFSGAEVLEHYVTQKSSKSIEELMKQVPNIAKLILEDGSIKEVSTKDLKVGDKIIVTKGNQIPIDAIIESKGLINESTLTGESIPVLKEKGDEVYAGTINEGEVFKAIVNKEEKDTIFSNIIRMVEQAQNNPSKKQRIIEKIESKYVISVLILVPLFILALVYIANYNLEKAFYRGIVLLTVASPCALIASATPATLSAISNAAKNGILFKDSRAIEIFKDIDIIATDKTGTLTYGEFEVISYELKKDILQEIIYIENNSNHPIAKAIINNFPNVDIKNVGGKIEEIAGVGLKMNNIMIGNLLNNSNFNDPYNYREKYKNENTLSLVAVNDEIVGYFELSDKIRESSKEAIRNFENNNVIFEMLTGDNENVAKNVSEELGINNYKAHLLPNDKMKFIKENQKNNKTVAMIGDGINDAPALANADIGISMGSGTSIAMETSDLVVVKNDLNKIFHSYKLSEKLNKIVHQNIIFSITVIFILIILNLLGILDLPSGVVFHEGSTIVVILNGLRLLGFKVK